MRITTETTICLTPDCEEDMSLEEKKFFQEMMTNLFKKSPHLIREKKLNIKKPFSNETMDVKIEIILEKIEIADIEERAAALLKMPRA